MPVSSRVRNAVLWAVACLLPALALAAAGAAQTVTVRPGETLSGIAARHGVTPSALAAANGITDPDRVVAGSRLVLPGGGGTPPSGGGSVAVRAGDTLSGIAARHGVSVSALAAANGVTNPPGIIRIGQTLRLPAGATAGSAVSGGGSVTVRAGDTLSGIAARHGVSISALAAANGVTNPPGIIRIGQTLRLPAGATAGTSTGGTVIVTVRAGDTLSGIAARHGVSLAAVVSANGITNPPGLIRVGQSLRVPGAAPGSTGAPRYAPVTVGVPRGAVGPLITQAAARHGVDAALARAVAWQESGYSQHMLSATGAVGVMQLMPDTVAWAGPSLLGRRIDPYNVYDNIDAGVAYLAWLQRRTGRHRRTAMAYYQGLRSLGERGPFDDTVQYADAVMSLIGRV